MFKTSRISYGGTAAVVTSTALICGLSMAHATESVIVCALLIAALADNLTDTLSVHIFQESERLEQKEAFTGTISNFATRLLLCLTFVLLIMAVPLAYAAQMAVVWGMGLLAGLTFLVARERRVKPLPEVCKHLLVAVLVIVLSMLIGHGIGAWLG